MLRQNWPTGLMVLQSNRLESLRDLMVGWMREYPLAPLEPETILVQSNGIAQWLKLALARSPETGGCGVAAALNIDLPGRFVWQAYRSMLPHLPQQSPFDKGPLTWRLLRLLGDLPALGERLAQVNGFSPAVLTPLSDFLLADDNPQRLYQLAARLADLYDQYQVYRADWLTAWAKGEAVKLDLNGRAQSLNSDEYWQPALWQVLVEDIQADERLGNGPWDRASRASIHQAFLNACQQRRDALMSESVSSASTEAHRPKALPRRVSILGISSLPYQILEVLAAIAPFTQVMLFVGNPSEHYWGDLIEGRDLLRRHYGRHQSEASSRKVPEGLSPDQLHLHGHPLLAAWGKQGRDYLHLLDEWDQPEAYRHHFIHERIDLFEDPGSGSLLSQLQQDILALRPLAESRELAREVDPDQDISMQFTIAHSPQREVEILQDQLLDAFERDATLQPRDILVMVPDIQQYVPHIEAVFGRLTRQDSRFLPYHIADQSPRHRQPLLVALEQLLHLPRLRMTTTELLDLLDIPALRARFGLEANDLPRLKQWAQGAQIRWGLSAEHRHGLSLPEGLEQNTWRFGLKRMLLGFASGDAEPWQAVEPYSEVGGLEAAQVGPLMQLVQALESTCQEWCQPTTPDQWGVRLHQLLARFFEIEDDSDLKIVTRLGEHLDQWLQQCQLSGLADQSLPLDVVREAWLGGLEQPTLTQKFLGGSVNFATLMPMRAVPFRCIWLLGMNDGDYPRQVPQQDFDLMVGDYRPGDRSRREDDRYLFLEALLAARDRLVISWVGRDIRDNSERPPSVLVGQLRDQLSAGWHLARQDDASEPPECSVAEALTQVHPLQPFSERYFQPDRAARLFTYAQEWRESHHREQPSQTVLPDWQPDQALNLNMLTDFIRDPMRHFYRQRLDIAAFQADEGVEDDEPFTLDALDSWQLQQQLILNVQRRLQEAPMAASEALLETAAEQLARAGQLPLPPFAQAAKTLLMHDLVVPISRYQQLLQAYPKLEPLQVHEWSLPGGGHFRDGLADLRCHPEGERLRLFLQPSRLYKGDQLKWHQIVVYWPGHLLAQRQGPVITRLLGPDSDLALMPLSPDAAALALDALIEAWQAGVQTPLPVPRRTSFAWLTQQSPATVYEGGFQSEGEKMSHPGWPLYWPDFEHLQADERFVLWAERLYRPLMSAVTTLDLNADVLTPMASASVDLTGSSGEATDAD
ncbi:exodeoxyribonuclease V subunit gamma [Terasakiispira papahanaumokuakeensis]|uniref:RecBCD enzyme subunit RecC n=1 Tax=Terasakiispira papahanaumokuakeensis TaxID=197479 RepID=A0A1E2V804_9GAMM|nr:exodeoxyribonuclease V subunit gamma [Terasakiispira papahanaumokuakeensis]ODC02982.1 exodeoxyribonuclease V subunit gamma [Terasakiispira papahanaumokuakeensis]